MASKNLSNGHAANAKQAIEVTTVQERFRANTIEVCKRVMNLVRRAEKIPESKRPAIPKLNDLQKILETLTPGVENPIKAEFILEVFFSGSFSIWESIFVKDQTTLMGVISKLLPKVNPETIAKYEALLTIIDEEKKPLMDEAEIIWFWKYFHQMIRQCLDYGLQKLNGKDSITINEQLTLCRKELESLKAKWETTKPAAGKP
jgi:hypothetical protein